MLTLLNRYRQKLFLLAVTAAVLSGVMTVAYARNTCVVKQQGGYTWYVSCGSSAGNFLYRCGGPEGCVACDSSICDGQANDWCAACDPDGPMPEEGPIS